MRESKWTKGPWKREGAFIYALQHHGWRKGVEQFCNRFSAGFSIGPGCSEEELLANAQLAEASPDLAEALHIILESVPMQSIYMALAHAALTKAGVEL